MIPHWDLIQEMLEQGWTISFDCIEIENGIYYGDVHLTIGDTNCHHGHGFDFESMHGCSWFSTDEHLDNRTHRLDTDIPRLVKLAKESIHAGSCEWGCP